MQSENLHLGLLLIVTGQAQRTGGIGDPQQFAVASIIMDIMAARALHSGAAAQ